LLESTPVDIGGVVQRPSNGEPADAGEQFFNRGGGPCQKSSFIM